MNKLSGNNLTYFVPKLFVFRCPGTNLEVAFGVAGVDLPGDEVCLSEREQHYAPIMHN